MALEATIKDLKERRAKVWEQTKTLLDAAAGEKRDLNAEETQTYARLNAELDGLTKRAEQVQQLVEDERALAGTLDKLGVPEQRDGDAGDTTTMDEIRKWITGENGARNLDIAAGKRMGANEFRTLSKLSAGAGANTVKTSFYERLVAHMIEVSAVLQAGPTVLQTSTGEQIQVPKTTAHSTASLVAEAGTISTSEPTFGQVPLDAYKYAHLMKISSELLTDTSVDLEGYLAMQGGRAVGNALGAALVTGTGSSQPNGVATAASTGVTGATSVAGAFTFDNLMDLFYSVIAPYRSSPSCGWLVKDSTMAAIRKLKDTTGQYLWQPALTADTPDILIGKPIRTDPNVAAPALSAKSVLFGDFSQYFVRLVGGVRFERSNDFAFDSDVVTFRCIIRGDGDLVDTTGAIKAFVGAAS